MPSKGAISKLFGVFKAHCSRAEMIIGIGLERPDCPNRKEQLDDGKQISDVDPNENLPKADGSRHVTRRILAIHPREVAVYAGVNRRGYRYAAFLVGALLASLTVCSTDIIAQNSAITAVWVNDGEDKVTQDEVRASRGQTVNNSLWNGSTISLFGLKNEVINF